MKGNDAPPTITNPGTTLNRRDIASTQGRINQQPGTAVARTRGGNQNGSYQHNQQTDHIVHRSRK
ncbi:hypothetical protein KP79_PYT23154 [Mizuhopecten yessoensis]|uniref:Uncharacterized protein n=1 Tax=Mizuhopecten yessoensis TaxID=6573 RepID=A0A210PQF9_MIZYE|nr:hypothetical protein KP79_PYT23154 [Mizuhopecten yessoensis]